MGLNFKECSRKEVEMGWACAAKRGELRWKEDGGKKEVLLRRKEGRHNIMVE